MNTHTQQDHFSPTHGREPQNMSDCGFFTFEAQMIKPQAQHRRCPMFNIPV